jgi:peptidoglycan/LPS O-acetylase OafA/YrhL
VASAIELTPVPRVVTRPVRSGYLPSLDGWRALAILAVLIGHDLPWTLFGHSDARFHSYGGWGVYLFFGISGFLVTTRILEDEAILGRFRIGFFYIRRVLRIQPAAIVFLAVLALLSAVGITHERHSALLGGLFLYQNYLYNAADTSGTWVLTGHFWTLSVEEHFYLLLSVLLFFVRRRRATVFFGCLLLLLVWQRLSVHLGIYNPVRAPRRTELNLQYLLLPALCAILLRRKPVLDWCLRFLRPWVVFAGTGVVCGLCLLTDRLPSMLRNTLLGWPEALFYAFGFWVIATVLHPRSWTTRFLELKPLRYVGRLSYSIYLWHILFFITSDPVAHVHNRTLLFLDERPWRYVATAVVSLLSYYGVEKPLIRLGHRLAPPATPGHADLDAAARRQ